MNQQTLNILLSAGGRRVALMRLLRSALGELRIPGRLVVADIKADNATCHLSDDSRLVPDYADPNCLDALLTLCREQEIGLIVPTIDPDLPFFAAHRGSFDEIGTRIMVSSAEAVAISNDKQATHGWLVENGFPTVRQTPAGPVVAGEAALSFPCFAKPRFGSSSIGARVVQNLDDLRLLARAKEYVVQEIAPGVEYTVDVYVDQSGACRCTVPRLRLQTRGGEVSKGLTVRCPLMQDLVRRVAETLPGARGALNIQVFYDVKRGVLNLIEINARFGGGYPLTHQAGAPMVRWLIEETLGLPLTAAEDQWTDGLVMLRYDEAVFVTRAEAGLDDPLQKPPEAAAKEQ